MATHSSSRKPSPGTARPRVARPARSHAPSSQQDGGRGTSRCGISLERCAQLLAAMAAPERLRIVRLLITGSRTVTEITTALQIPPLNIAHHLSVLKHAQIISGRKAGRFVHYSLCEGVLVEAIAAGIPKEALDLGCCQLVLPDDPVHADGNPPRGSRRRARNCTG